MRIDRERQRPAFILRREHQIDEHDAQEEDDDAAAGKPLLVGKLGPFDAE